MTVFENEYACDCGEHWLDYWSCACNDRCPGCNREIEPCNSIELDEDEDTPCLMRAD